MLSVVRAYCKLRDVVHWAGGVPVSGISLWNPTAETRPNHIHRPCYLYCFQSKTIDVLDLMTPRQ
jgi:hypothetical protein